MTLSHTSKVISAPIKIEQRCLIADEHGYDYTHVTPWRVLSCDVHSVLFWAWGRIRTSVWWCTSIKSSYTQDWYERECQVEPMLKTSGGETNRRSMFSRVMQGKRQRPASLRDDESPQWNNPKVLWSGSGDCVMNWKKSSLPYKLDILRLI